MFTKTNLCLCFALLCKLVIAQEKDANINLQEVVVSDINLFADNKSQSIQVLNDSVITKNQSSITDLLKNNTVIYFKENGSGGATSVSFRGTSALQTAVVWNGININSNLSGQTDFSTINAYDFNSVSIKAGGGSVNYGTGAIGGTIHLGNDMKFTKSSTALARADFGSFHTYSGNVKVAASDSKLSWQAGFFYKNSINNYPYTENNLDGDIPKNNYNGEYNTTSFNGSIGYKPNESSIIKFYNQTSRLDRNFPFLGSYPKTNKDKNISNFTRNLLEYNRTKDRLTTGIKLAYLYEQFKYITEIEEPEKYTLNKTKNIIAKTEIGYKLLEKLKISGFADYSYTNGNGDDIENGNVYRKTASVATILKFTPNQKWQTEAGIRAEYCDNYKAPLLFSVGSSYMFGDVYNLKLNISKNYRIPSFNDLFWKSGQYTVGNPDLTPETSLQAEIGNVFSFKKFIITETFYVNDIKDMIQWATKTDDSYVYMPKNIANVINFGAETLLSWYKNVGNHLFKINATYSYTKSEDRSTKKQLIYVPFHKITSAVAYNYKKISANYQFLYNGFVYTQNDDTRETTLPSYSISNIGIDYETSLLKSTKIGFQISNLFNTSYKNFEYMYMPGRAFNIYLIGTIY